MWFRQIANALFKKANSVNLLNANFSRPICASAAFCRLDDWRRHRKSVPKVDEGTRGEATVVLDSALNK